VVGDCGKGSRGYKDSAYVVKSKLQEGGGSLGDKVGVKDKVGLASVGVVKTVGSAAGSAAPAVLPSGPQLVVGGAGHSDVGSLQVVGEVLGVNVEEPGPVAAGSVHLLDDHAPERIQAWLLSGPKEIRDAAAVPMKDRVDAVFSALPLALGVAGVFTRAASSEIRGAGNSDEGGVGAVDSVVTPMMVLPSTGVCSSAVGRTDLLVAPAVVAAPPAILQCPEEGLGAGDAVWTAVGKKRKQKMAGQSPLVVRPGPGGEGVGVEGLLRQDSSTSVLKGKVKGKAMQSSK